MRLHSVGTEGGTAWRDWSLHCTSLGRGSVFALHLAGCTLFVRRGKVDAGDCDVMECMCAGGWLGCGQCPGSCCRPAARSGALRPAAAPWDGDAAAGLPCSPGPRSLPVARCTCIFVCGTGRLRFGLQFRASPRVETQEVGVSAGGRGAGRCRRSAPSLALACPSRGSQSETRRCPMPPLAPYPTPCALLSASPFLGSMGLRIIELLSILRGAEPDATAAAHRGRPGDDDQVPGRQ